MTIGSNLNIIRTYKFLVKQFNMLKLKKIEILSCDITRCTCPI